MEENAVCPLHGVEGVELEDQSIPTRVAAQFRVQGLIGAGDTGTLYQVEDAKTGAPGVLKLLRLSPNVQAAGRDRLMTELDRQVKLGSKAHLSVPRRVGREGDVVWVFRQWIEGESLKARLFSHGPLPTADAIAITAQIVEALEELHRAGLVHHAVRPGHIILRNTDGETPDAVLIEPGMAGKNERFSVFEDLGNVYYMPPELAMGKTASFRSDIYSLGCVFIDALTGDPPFDGESAEAIVAAHRFTLPSIPDALPSAVGEILKKMLAKVPSDRGTSTTEIKNAFKPFIADTTPARTSKPPPLRPTPPPAVDMSALKPSAMPPPARSIDAMRPSSVPPPAQNIDSMRPSSMPPPAKSMDAVADQTSPKAEPSVRPRQETPAPIDLVRVKESEPPPPADSYADTSFDPASEPPPAAQSTPPRRIAELDSSSVARLSEPMDAKPEPVTPRASGFSTPDLSDEDDLVLARPKRRRWTWLVAGFLLGTLSAAGALYGLAMYGEFHLVTGAMEDYLQVPGENLVSVASPPSAIDEACPDDVDGGVALAAMADAAVDAAVDAPDAGIDGAADATTDADAGDVSADADAAADADDGATDADVPDAEADADATAETPAMLTRAERRAARRAAALERRRRERARERREARRARMRAPMSSGDNLDLNL